MGIRALYTFCFCLLLSLPMLAQNEATVHKINGKKYYLHIVEPKNTLYGISRLYKVDIESILEENPLVKEEGLKVNQTLLVPVTKINRNDLGGLIEEDENFMVHKVQPKETLFTIAKQYSVDLGAILDANPEVKANGLKANSEIKIPVAHILPEARKTIDASNSLDAAMPDSLEGHIVKQGETLYSLSKQYDVDITELKKANDELPFGLKTGMVLRIPGRIVPMPDISGMELDDLDAMDTGPKDLFVDTLGPLTIGILFPFQVTFPDSATSDNDFKVSGASRVAMSFYRGMQFAFDSLFADGPRNLDIRVYDTGADTHAIHKMKQSGALDELEVIYGPFYSEQFEMVCDAVGQNGVPVICPVPKPSKILFKRHTAIKTVPSQTMQLHSLAEYVAANYADSNLVVVNSNRVTDEENLEFFKSSYRKAIGLSDTSRAEAIKEIRLWDINKETLSMRFGDSGSYVLIVPSTHKVFVSRLLTGLFDLGNRKNSPYHFTVFGMEEWLKMEDNLDIRALHSLNVTLALSSYLDHGDYRVQRLYRMYREHYGYEPDQYAIQGFDLVYYLHQQLTKHPNEWAGNPESFPIDGLFQSYYLRRITKGSGLENRAISLYKYEQFRLKKVATWPQTTDARKRVKLLQTLPQR